MQVAFIHNVRKFCHSVYTQRYLGMKGPVKCEELEQMICPILMTLSSFGFYFKILWVGGEKSKIPVVSNPKT